MLGGQGRAPSLQRRFVTTGQEWSTPASGSSEAREMPAPTPFSKAFQETGFALPGGRGRRFRDFSEITQVGPPAPRARASSVPEPGSSLAGPPRALAAPERWKVLVPGEEAAMRTPGPLVTEPAGWGSSRSLRTGPRCYCSCGEPWSRTPRARRATPAPGRWGR